jgi:hypothetical protein
VTGAVQVFRQLVGQEFVAFDQKNPRVLGLVLAAQGLLVEDLPVARGRLAQP